MPERRADRQEKGPLMWLECGGSTSLLPANLRHGRIATQASRCCVSTSCLSRLLKADSQVAGWRDRANGEIRVALAAHT